MVFCLSGGDQGFRTKLYPAPNPLEGATEARNSSEVIMNFILELVNACPSFPINIQDFLMPVSYRRPAFSWIIKDGAK